MFGVILGVADGYCGRSRNSIIVVVVLSIATFSVFSVIIIVVSVGDVVTGVVIGGCAVVIDIFFIISVCLFL